MSNVKVNDTVRIGKSGKVDYIVRAVHASNDLDTGAVTVESLNSGKQQTVEESRLTIVESFEPVAIELDAPIVEREIKSVEGVTYPLAAWEVQLLATHGKRFSLVLNDRVVGYKSFEAAAFALSRAKGTYTHASIDDHNKGKRVAERLAA
jgi:hypothetical protein